MLWNWPQFMTGIHHFSNWWRVNVPDIDVYSYTFMSYERGMKCIISLSVGWSCFADFSVDCVMYVGKKGRFPLALSPLNNFNNRL